MRTILDRIFAMTMSGRVAAMRWCRISACALGLLCLFGLATLSAGGKRGKCPGFMSRAPAAVGELSRRPSSSSASSCHAARRTPPPTPLTPPLQRHAISASSNSRRDVMIKGGVSTLLGMLGLATTKPPRIASAADAPAAPAAPPTGPKKWMSGKSEKPRGSKDRTGTKKDSNYLRCLSDCTTECRKPGQGPSKDNAECLEACQDYCCQTYEQCTYTQNYEG